MAVMSLLTLGMVSAIRIATHALPNAERPAHKVNRSGGVLANLADELSTAIHITERSPSAITFTVADRNNDGSPENIRFAWSGTKGAALTRQYNHGSAATVLDDVHQFDLGFTKRSVIEQYSGAAVDSAETLLVARDVPVVPADFAIKDKAWIGQYFRPTLPVGATAWRVTRVLVMARVHGANKGITSVQLRLPAADNTPSGTILEEVPMLESALSASYAWEQFAFSANSGLSPNEGLCLVLARQLKDAHLGDVLFDAGGGSGLLDTPDASKTWSSSLTTSMVYYVYGTYMIPGPPQTAKRDYVTEVQVALQIGSDTASRLETSVLTLNTPEVLSDVWESDFSSDPTALDINGDGVVDWAEAQGIFLVSSLVSDVWEANGTVTLGISPSVALTEMTTIRVGYRDPLVAGNGARFRTEFDQSGGGMAVITAALELNADGTQTLTLTHDTGPAVPEKLAVCAGLPSGFIDLRMILDPVADTVAAFVDGVHMGTYGYVSYGGSSNATTISGVNVPAEFDYVSIRVGGNYP